MKKLFVAFTCTALPFASAAVQTCTKQSPAHTVALLELYTSEGCSSCPPADRFLHGLRKEASEAGLTSDRVVPLALHVDYWDYIGWKDAYAKRGFTERQRWLAAQAGTKTVYTPEFFAGGRELRDWRDDTAARVKQINERPAKADIGITLGTVADGMLPVEVHATSGMAGQLFVALYENGLTSEVRAGENRGAVLRHDYVVREWLGPVTLAGEGAVKRAEMSRRIAVPKGAVVKNLGAAAFVQGENGEVLQAVSLQACGGSI